MISAFHEPKVKENNIVYYNEKKIVEERGTRE
jgi:hypothetical protein